MDNGPLKSNIALQTGGVYFHVCWREGQEGQLDTWPGFSVSIYRVLLKDFEGLLGSYQQHVLTERLYRCLQTGVGSLRGFGCPADSLSSNLLRRYACAQTV